MTDSPYYAYLFEARGIQRFLFASGKLRDMLGASELVDFICADNGLLDQVLDSLDLAPLTVRKAGGVFYLVFRQKADAVRLQATWRLACAHWLPGLERVDALAEGPAAQAAVRAGIAALHVQRNIVSADLPCPGPLSERSPRTGLAAVTREAGEALDAATQAVRSFRRPAGSATLASRFLRDADHLHWPTNFEENARAEQRFPLGANRLVGLLHADGNGLGELLRLLNDACANADDLTYIKLFRLFSSGISKATVDAAHVASSQVLVPAAVQNVLPARPLVLGGDDVSLILRADLALPFARAFLLAFEQESRTAMTALKAEFAKAGLGAHAGSLPDHLTACAGVSFIKCNQPFLSAYEIAEGLCSRAKRLSRQARDEGSMPSSVAFLRLQDSLLEDIDALYHQTMTAEHNGRRYALGLPAYTVSAHARLPSLAALEQLASVFASRSGDATLNDRPLRELATLLHTNLDEARQRYQRWRQIADRQAPKALKRFDEALTHLIGNTVEGLPAGIALPGTDSDCASPLGDLLALQSVGQIIHTEVPA